MRYLYKIYSPYDGFFPKRIPNRLVDGRFLTLGWAKYLDALNIGDEVWIVFTGPKFENGVYVKGSVAAIDSDANTVQLRVHRHSQDAPLTDAETSVALCAAVKSRFRQVFFWPSDRVIQDNCHVVDCGERRCLKCEVWNSIPQIDPKHYAAPSPLRGEVIIPAYWAVPRRCYLYYGSRKPAPWARWISDMFSSFKVGEGRYAYPFAAGIDAALRAQNQTGFDGIIPIPLSPEKAAANELDRTGVLAAEVSKLVGAPVRSYLSLTNPISKRRMMAQGFTPSQFKARYKQYLQVDPAIAGLGRILVVDDAITKGSTLSVVLRAVRDVAPNIDIVVVSAVQMIVKDVVADQNGPAF